MTTWTNNDNLVQHYGPRLKYTKVCETAQPLAVCDEDQPTAIADDTVYTYAIYWNTDGIQRGFGPLKAEE